MIERPSEAGKRQGGGGPAAGNGAEADEAPAPPLLKTLLRERHWQTFPMFKREYRKAAEKLDKDLVASCPTDRTLARWLSGRVEAPRAEHCAVLEAMFPGWVAADLFKPDPATGGADHESTLLRELLRRDAVYTYRAFSKAYDDAAQRVNSSMVGSGPSERQFYRWITGEMVTVPYRDHCAVLEAMFPGHTAQQLFTRFDPGQPESSTTINADETNGVDLRTLREEKFQSTTVSQIVISRDPGSVDPEIDASTPQLIRSVEATLLAASDESANFLAWAEVNNVGELTIDQIQADIRRIAQNYLKAPTMPLFGRVRKLRDRAFSLLAGHQSPTQSRDLYSAAGWSLTVLAWMTTDLGHPEMAEDHLRAAWLCAENAEQDNLRAWVRATQHTAAFWQNDFTAAARYAEDGLRYATAGTTELYLASAWALDLARLGDHDSAQVALNWAQNAANLGNKNGRLDELAGPFSCSVARAGGFWSDTHLTLGDAKSALSYADSAVSMFESMSADSRNFGSERMVRCQQVKAHMMLSEFDGAVEALSPVLDTAPDHRVGPLAQRVREIRDMAASQAVHGKTRMVERIQDATVEFQRNQP